MDFGNTALLSGNLPTLRYVTDSILLVCNIGFISICKVKTTGFSRSAFSYDSPGGLRCPSKERNLEPSHIASKMTFLKRRAR